MIPHEPRRDAPLKRFAHEAVHLGMRELYEVMYVAKIGGTGRLSRHHESAGGYLCTAPQSASTTEWYVGLALIIGIDSDSPNRNDDGRD